MITQPRHLKLKMTLSVNWFSLFIFKMGKMSKNFKSFAQGDIELVSELGIKFYLSVQ